MIKIEFYNLVLADKTFREIFNYYFLKPNRFIFESFLHSEKIMNNPVFLCIYFLNVRYYRYNYDLLPDNLKNINPYKWIDALDNFPNLQSEIIINGIKKNYYAKNIEIVNYLLGKWQTHNEKNNILKNEWQQRIDWRRNYQMKLENNLSEKFQ
jgi:hypothetical protein